MREKEGRDIREPSLTEKKARNERDERAKRRGEQEKKKKGRRKTRERRRNKVGWVARKLEGSGTQAEWEGRSAKACE
eukprot:6177435-Pleurochrysis_carterae.AAC.1